jgi:Fe-S-cluster-containing dehydrogenase component
VKKWNMVIDLALCHDCNNCFLSCKDEYVDNDFSPYSVAQPWFGQRWMNIERKERGQYPMVQVAYLPTPCQHCGDAPCMAAAPEGTIYRRADGLVIIDPEKAKGHAEIVDMCPYGVIYWNEEADIAQKCTGCAHLIDDGWVETRCSLACPTGSLRLVLAEDEEVATRAAAEGLEAYRADLGTSPRVWYKNLHRWTTSFVAGTVAYCDTDDCAKGAVATLAADGREIAETTTNNYGDFRIDGLHPGRYDLIIGAAGYDPEILALELGESVTVRPVFLQRHSNGRQSP